MMETGKVCARKCVHKQTMKCMPTKMLNKTTYIVLL